MPVEEAKTVRVLAAVIENRKLIDNAHGFLGELENRLGMVLESAKIAPQPSPPLTNQPGLTLLADRLKQHNDSLGELCIKVQNLITRLEI